VFAPNSKYRALETPARRGKGKKAKAPHEAQDQTPAERHASMMLAILAHPCTSRHRDILTNGRKD